MCALEQQEWPGSIMTMVGVLLVSRLIQVAKINVGTVNMGKWELALAHEKRWKRGKVMGMIVAHDKLVELLTKEPARSWLGMRLPMLVKPVDWTTYKNGGYLAQPTSLIRNKTCDDSQQLYVMAAAHRGDLKELMDSLNVLGSTAWRINQRVLKVMVNVWNSGKGIGGLPHMPPNQDEYAVQLEPEPSRGETPKEWAQWRYKKRQLDNERKGLHSNRCFINLQLEIAKAYAKETFYFPHSIDFRGRAYPIPSAFNHMGADNARGLLEFSEGKPLGNEGMFWLKVHLANVYGYDKASLEERRDYTDKHIEMVLDSAHNPLDGQRWWLKAENPWQCLAACMEVKDALELGDQANEFVSHLPVHQDGTCNGLQHYAALGGDEYGASQVNLEPGERPADVYSEVADLVRKEVEKDIRLGNDEGGGKRELCERITRKVVKQTVMTSVYGVTYVGAREQVRKQLNEIVKNENIGEWKEELSGYVTRKIFEGLERMFGGANLIQRWLEECAKRITRSVTRDQIKRIADIDAIVSKEAPEGPAEINLSKSKEFQSYVKMTSKRLSDGFVKGQFRSSVIWTTPLRLPVVQPYRKAVPRKRLLSIESSWGATTGTNQGKSVFGGQKKISFLEGISMTDQVSGRKHVQAFPPNFIHSLDATHMMLSALRCNKAGLTFASIHDSFWTHACTVPAMNRVLREEFIKMHEESVIGRLAEEFNLRYARSMYLRKVERDSRAAEMIVKWRRERRRQIRQITTGMSNQRKKCGLLDELLLEFKRQEGLYSADEKVRQKALEMDTPAAIYERLDGTLQGQDTDDGESCKLTGESKVDLSSSPLYIWMRVTFPDIPRRGTFNVQRLKASRYFFS